MTFIDFHCFRRLGICIYERLKQYCEVTTQMTPIFQFLEKDSTFKRTRQNGALLIHKNTPSALFDGAYQGEKNRFGLGGLLYISDSHYYKIMAFLGSCNNNCVELMATRTLLMVAMSKRIS